MSTCTRTIELDQLPKRPAPSKQNSGEGIILSESTNSSVQRSSQASEDGNAGSDCRETTVMPKWTDPGNPVRMAATFWSLFVMGANDAAYGALIPYLQTFYGLNFTVISLVFLSPFIGYVSSALLNNYIHLRWGQRGIAIVSSGSHIAAYIIIAVHPPYPVLVLSFILAGFGNGVADAAWNAWMSNLANSSELLGFLHALYGVGGVISPLVSTTMITKGNLPWYNFYYIMIGISVVELASTTYAFWSSNGTTYRALQTDEDSSKDNDGLSAVLFHRPSARVAWTAAAFLLCYVGVEVSLGGWIVKFMMDVRKGDDFSSGMSATGFWLGITVGRVVLGFVSPRVGIKLSTSIYIAATIGLELIFWLVPQFLVSAVAVALQGFFLGPLFPSVVLVANKLLPKRYHVRVIGFAAAFGGCGAAVLPFLTGLLAQSSSGVQVLQPIVLAMVVMLLVIWLLFPRLQKKSE